jgi:hypothetical protein
VVVFILTEHPKKGAVTDLRGILENHVNIGPAPGAVGLVARPDRVELEAVGSVEVEGTSPMTTDSIFRIGWTGLPATTGSIPQARSSWSMPEADREAAHRFSHPARAGWTPPWSTGTPSP